jgi:hypothetical protein
MDSLQFPPILQLYNELGQRLAAQPRAADALTVVVQVAVDMVPGVHFASITRARSGADRYRTAASTHEAAAEADRTQYELGEGPCVDAARGQVAYYSGDLAADARWPLFGPLAVAGAGVRSVLATRLMLEEEHADAVAGLNLYAKEPEALRLSRQS